MTGKTLRSLMLALALAGAAVTPVHAAPPAQLKTQAPGYFRMALGDFVVTALYDGYIDIDPKLLKGASAQDIQTLLARMFLQSTPGVQTAVNAFLVHTGDKLVLVDGGANKCFGPTLGNIGANLKAAGYTPEQVDLVLLTHLHPDHACGLATDDGKPAFPNADVYVSRTESGYWLDDETVAKAPKEMQPFFKMAKDSILPYARQGRFKVFDAGDKLLPGVTSAAAAGHTPGHTGYLITSKNQSLLLWGDLVHSHSVQFARPEVALEFDVNSEQAIAARKAIFASAAKDKLWVGGAHLPFPGIGHVRADGNAYAWVPIEYGPIRSDR
ncbi:MBL fold metallo-hydrolase [Jeongeupia naejangsanensis]|uniref:MBL fold metallo-hydrolase n=1 Tax=Jeongeupia naejangsanensis TaxID=613195 RepID=A0ABS2BHE8_9NEIS|nr:MBL fold metallo-hydrolase [Jeongeupia naejangsanensis]MBM3115037.1 MBL fold metallo-hydrolase [Jeongeupia naejangsanensis]